MKFEDMCIDPQSIQDTPLQALMDLQQECYERRVSTMVTPAIEKWSDLMTERYGPKVMIGLSRPLTWPAALAVVRYGGAPILVDGTVFWPDQFTADDEKRAAAWLMGKNPSGVQYLN